MYSSKIEIIFECWRRTTQKMVMAKAKVLNLVDTGVPTATDDAARKINAPVHISFQKFEIQKGFGKISCKTAQDQGQHI
jgi:hypothetical protein